VSASPECLKSRGEFHRLRTGSPAHCCTAPRVGFFLAAVHPRLLQFGHLVVPTYGALVALGIVLALVVSLRTGRLAGLDTGKLWNLALLAILVSIGGAKLLLAAFNWRRYGLRSFAIGLSGADAASLAGIAAAILACWLYARKVGLPVRRTADALAPAIALFSSVAAIGCLEAGCGYGTPTRMPWAIVFTAQSPVPGVPVGVPLHPTQIYSALMEFVLFVLLLWLLHRSHRDGEVMGSWLFLSGLGRYLLAFLRGDGGGKEIFGGLVSLTQLTAAFMVVAGGALWLQRTSAGARSQAADPKETHAA
jgi:phosphatidylglycerol---prolipoprotein diacylglyceryl transferase